MNMDVVYDGKKSAALHMQRDQELIDHLQMLKKPLLRLYEWASPAVTYGYFINPDAHFISGISEFDCARRPTGGGILFHVHDLTFSVAVPKTDPRYSDNVLANYASINCAVLKAVQEVCDALPIALQQEKATSSFHEFCMATPTQYDLLFNGRKIGGAAQRKTKYGFLHQASIFLKEPPWDKLEKCLCNGKVLVKEMQKTSAHLFDAAICDGAAREQLVKAIIRNLSQAFSFTE